MIKRFALSAALLLGACFAGPDDSESSGSGGTAGTTVTGGGFGGGFGGVGAGGSSIGGGTAGKGGASGNARPWCEPLAPPSGKVIRVTPADTSALASIVADAPPGTTISFADGVYTPVPRLNVRAAGVSLRSESANELVVELDGAYATDEVVAISASNVTIAYLTIKRAINHPIHVSPPDAGPDVTGVHLFHLRVIDGGEQFVKVNPNGDRTFWVDGGNLECSSLQLTDEGRTHVVSLPGLPCYTGGIDAHAARGWVVRGNTFRDFWCQDGLSEHAIHFWSSSRDTITEDNIIVNSARGIGYGLGETGVGRDYPDNPYPSAGFLGHYDGIIRNNTVFADIDGFDTGIALEQARGVRVIHNTVFSTSSSDAGGGGFSSIDARFAGTKGGEIRNNLVRRISTRDGATPSADHNLENVPPEYFVNAGSRDLHLSPAAVNAIDKGVVLPDTGLDLDGLTRGPSPDLGAYERR
jgi:hypothetical protein